MAQICKLEQQTVIKSSPDRLFDVYKNSPNLMLKISPHKLQSIEVLEGDGKSVGSVRLWSYNLGSIVIAKDKIDAVDEQNKSITFDLIGGEVTKHYKSFKATLAATTSKNNVNLVKWTLEFEKGSEDVPIPHSHIEFLMNVSREVDAYLINE